MSKKYPIFSEKEPSELILQVFRTNSGGPVRNCENCGRTHFDENGEFMDEGELVEMERAKKLDPDGYVPHNGDVSSLNIHGKEVVPYCEFNYLSQLEDLLWSERERIMEYLRKRAEANAERSKRDLQITRPI